MTADRIIDLIGKASRLADRMDQRTGGGVVPPDRADRVKRLRTAVRAGQTVVQRMASDPGLTHPRDRRTSCDRRLGRTRPAS